LDGTKLFANGLGLTKKKLGVWVLTLFAPI
jgi:hypothetical protein